MIRATVAIALVMVVSACAARRPPDALSNAESVYRLLVSQGAERQVEGLMLRTRDALAEARSAFDQNRDPRYVEGLARVARDYSLAAQADFQRVRAETEADSLTKARLARLTALTQAQREAMMRQQQLSQAEIDSLSRANLLVSQQADSLRRAAEAASARLNEALGQLRTLVSEITNLRETSRGLVISLSDILFETGKATMKPGAAQNVGRIAGILNQYPDYQIVVEGHADSRGADAFNQTLSENRARAVYSALVDAGVSTSRISSKGFGETQPIGDNNTAEGRQQNRRVEVVVLGAGSLADAAKRDSLP